MNYEGVGASEKVQSIDTDTSMDVLPITSLVMDATKVYLWWILENKKKMYSDRRLLQRLLRIWPADTRDSYLTDVLSGKSQKDLFILARIAPIVEELQKRIDEELDPKKKKAIQGNLEYFQTLLDSDYEWLVIDGQHRLDNLAKFFASDGSEYVSNIGGDPKFRFKVKDTKGSYVPFDITSRSFYDWPEGVKEFVMTRIPFLVSIVTEGDVKELKLLFVGANNADPLNDFEKLVIESYGETVRYIMDLVDTHDKIGNPMWQLEYPFKFTKMTNRFSSDKRGDALAYSEELHYILNEYKVVGDKDEALRKIYADDFLLPKHLQDLHHKSVKIRSLGCKNLKKVDGMSRINSASALILLFIMWDKNHPARDGLDFSTYEVSEDKEEEFMDWFFKGELTRLEKDKYLLKNGKPMVDDNGNKLQNPDSYSSFCRYGFEKLSVRHRELVQDFDKSKDHLVATGVIHQTGKKFSNPVKERSEMAVKQNWKNDFGQDITFMGDISGPNPLQVGHVKPKSKGGSPDDGRKLIGRTRNIRESNS